MKKISVDAQNNLEKFKDQIVEASYEQDAQQRHAAVSTLVEHVTDECKSRSLFYQILQLVLLCTIFVNTMIAMSGYYNSKIKLEKVRMETSMLTAPIKQDAPNENLEERVVKNSPNPKSIGLTFGSGNTITISGGMMAATPGIPPHLVPMEKLKGHYE